MPGRNYTTSNGYRYGFNGMEKDDEIKNIEGSNLDFDSRMYDSRLGRWMSVDPAARSFPSMSPFIGMGDNPIYLIDQDGEYIIIHYKNIFGKEKSVLYSPGEKHVRLNRFVKQTEKALNYTHAKDSKGVITRLANDTKNMVDLYEAPGETAKSDPYSSKVTYDPFVGLAVLNENREYEGQITSAALNLYHDLAHKFNQYYDPEYLKRRIEIVEDYDNAEEEYVIKNFEVPLAKKLGEAIRKNHRGEESPVPNSTYHGSQSIKDFAKKVDRDIAQGVFDEGKPKAKKPPKLKGKLN